MLILSSTTGSRAQRRWRMESARCWQPHVSLAAGNAYMLGSTPTHLITSVGHRLRIDGMWILPRRGPPPNRPGAVRGGGPLDQHLCVVSGEREPTMRGNVSVGEFYRMRRACETWMLEAVVEEADSHVRPVVLEKKSAYTMQSWTIKEPCKLPCTGCRGVLVSSSLTVSNSVGMWYGHCQTVRKRSRMESPPRRGTTEDEKNIL